MPYRQRNTRSFPTLHAAWLPQTRDSGPAGLTLSGDDEPRLSPTALIFLVVFVVVIAVAIGAALLFLQVFAGQGPPLGIEVGYDGTTLRIHHAGGVELAPGDYRVLVDGKDRTRDARLESGTGNFSAGRTLALAAPAPVQGVVVRYEGDQGAHVAIAQQLRRAVRADRPERSLGHAVPAPADHDPQGARRSRRRSTRSRPRRPRSRSPRSPAPASSTWPRPTPLRSRPARSSAATAPTTTSRSTTPSAGPGRSCCWRGPSTLSRRLTLPGPHGPDGPGEGPDRARVRERGRPGTSRSRSRART